MATKGRQRRQERRARRRESRQLRKSGPKAALYGGTQERLDKYREDAELDIGRAERREQESYSSTRNELGRTRTLEKEAEDDRRGYEQTARGSRDAYSGDVDAIGDQANRANYMRTHALGGATGTRNQAYAQNQLTGTAENALARRTQELQSVPSIGSAVNTAIGANNAAAQARLGQSMGLANRQARGMAGSLGEGGALALQQAMASSGANAADLMAQNNTMQSQLAADLRLQGAMRQNEIDVGSADLGLNTRMGAAEAERANQMAVAAANAGDILSVGDANAGNAYDAALQTANARANLMQQDATNRGAADTRQLALLGARNDTALNLQQLSQQGLRDANQNQQFVEGTQAGADQAVAMGKYAAAVENSPLNKLRNVLGGIRTVKSIGAEGSALSGLTGIGKSQ
jgi:hypothetical protein